MSVTSYVLSNTHMLCLDSWLVTQRMSMFSVFYTIAFVVPRGVKKIDYLLGGVLKVDLGTRLGQLQSAQVIGLGMLCCISFELAAHFYHPPPNSSNSTIEAVRPAPSPLA